MEILLCFNIAAKAARSQQMIVVVALVVPSWIFDIAVEETTKSDTTIEINEKTGQPIKAEPKTTEPHKAQSTTTVEMDCIQFIVSTDKGHEVREQCLPVIPALK